MSIFEKKAIDRFWSKVAKKDEQSCWLWNGSSMGTKSDNVRYQYGRFWANGKHYKAHRVSYIISTGVIPKNQVVRHKCDNPLCVNPSHLKLGTKQENDKDRMDRGRTRNGASGKITEQRGLTAEQKVLITLEAAISAYTIYAKDDALKSTRLGDWQRVVDKMRSEMVIRGE